MRENPNAIDPTRFLKAETLIADLDTKLRKRESNSFSWKVDIIQPVANGTPAAAPALGATASGSITESREWGFQYVSTESSMQTAISSALTATLTSANISFSGARSTDARMDKVQIVTRAYGDTDLAWRVVEQIANPTSGNWYYTDNSPYSAYVANDPPLVWKCLLYGAIDPNILLRRVKLFADRALAPSSSIYWVLGLAVYGDQRGKARYTLSQDTTKVGLTEQSVYSLPLFRQFADAPSKDLDWALEENDRLYLTLRGVGAVTPLPRLSAMVDVTREVP